MFAKPLSPLFLAAALLPGICAAQDAPANPAEPAAQVEPAVPAALRGITFLMGSPDCSAKYYIYLQSASWCGPCRRAMPFITKAYPELKENGVEIILCCCDRSEEATIAYAKSHGVTFPVIWQRSPDAAKLPGYHGPCGIPHLIIVSAEGKVLREDHPMTLFRNDAWKSCLPTQP